jgi:hypothetical protein
MQNRGRDNSPRTDAAFLKGSPSAHAGSDPKPVNILEELPALQKLVVLAQLYTNALAEAKAACLQHDHAKAYELVRGAREQYCRKFRQHIGKEPDTRGLGKGDALKALARHQQINDTLARFDRVLPLLERMSQSKPEKQPAPNQQTEPKLTVKLSENIRQELQAAQGAEAQFKVVQTYFNTVPVHTSQQIRDGSFYSLLHQGEILLLLCKSNVVTSDAVGMSLAFTGQDLKPILRRHLLEFGKQNRLHQLDLKEVKAVGPARMAVADSSQSPGDTRVRTISEFFASLIPVAKASGLPLNIDAIVFVRDHDLPLQQYQAAFSTINGLYLNMEAVAGRLIQQIRKDEQDHASGVLKMSALEWQKKKQRDTEQTTKVNSALRYFRLALDQLNTLISPGD